MIYLHDDLLVTSEQRFERLDYPPQIRLVLVVVVQPLGVHHIMHSDEALILVL